VHNVDISIDASMHRCQNG